MKTLLNVTQRMAPKATKANVSRAVLYAKHLCIRTPLEGPAKQLQWWLQARQRREHPELEEVYLEATRIEHVLRRALPPNGNCVDIGCHLGSMLSLLVSACPEGRFWAFEPVAMKSRWLRYKFPEVSVHTLALSDQPGRMTFFEDLSQSAYSSLARPVAAHATREYEVECARADDILGSHRPIHFIKIDVEGAELKALDGARGILRRNTPLLLLECTPQGLQRFGHTPQDWHAYITDELRYELRTPLGQLEGGPALTRHDFERTQTYPFRAFNYFACPAAQPRKSLRRFSGGGPVRARVASAGKPSSRLGPGPRRSTGHRTNGVKTSPTES